jgi:hypothetical protein
MVPSRNWYCNVIQTISVLTVDGIGGMDDLVYDSTRNLLRGYHHTRSWHSKHSASLLLLLGFSGK